METNKIYLGVSGKVNHTQASVSKYNNLLERIGEVEMLTQFERFIDEEELIDFIKFIEDNLQENNIIH